MKEKMKKQSMQYWKSHNQFNEMLWAFEQAFSCTHSKPSVVIGEGTDLLVIVCFHGKMDECELYLFRSEVKEEATTNLGYKTNEKQIRFRGM